MSRSVNDAEEVAWTRAAKVAAHRARAFRALVASRAWPGTVVLCYHGVRDVSDDGTALPFGSLHVPADRLAEHLEAIRGLCTPVSLSALLDGLGGRGPVPPRAVHVTFDDGYRSVAERALPLLARYDVPASIFVCRRPSESGTLFWFDAMSRALGDRAVVDLRDSGRADWTRVVADWSPAVPPGDELAPMSPEEIGGLSSHPLIEIGSHTRSHLPLAQLTTEDQHAEIAAGIAAVTEWTGRPPQAFAYPVGRSGRDFDERTRQVLTACGVEAAFSTEEGWAGRGRPPLDQPRFLMVDGFDGVELAYRLAWRWRA